jgi:peptidoglycan/xylan/chitin deacetylase (PgdA/CDA1 family)
MNVLTQLAKPISLEKRISFRNSTHYVAITFDDGFVSVIENALPELALRKIPSTLFIPSGCLGENPGWLEQAIENRFEVIATEDQLKTLNGELVLLGSHGVSHSKLVSLSEEKAKNEIVESKRTLEALTGHPVKLLAFPFGAFNKELVKWARQAGYERVFSIWPRMAFSEPHEFVTGRVVVSPNDWLFEFKLKLLGAYRWLPLAFVLKRKVLLIKQTVLRFLTNTSCTKTTQAMHRNTNYKNEVK